MSKLHPKKDLPLLPTRDSDVSLFVVAFWASSGLGSGPSGVEDFDFWVSSGLGSGPSGVEDFDFWVSSGLGSGPSGVKDFNFWAYSRVRSSQLTEQWERLDEPDKFQNTYCLEKTSLRSVFRRVCSPKPGAVLVFIFSEGSLCCSEFFLKQPH